MSFADRLKVLIDEVAGGNQSAFARTCGLRDGSIRQYLAGSKPGFDHLAAISKGTGRSLNWLVYGSDDGSQRPHNNMNSGAPIDPVFFQALNRSVAEAHHAESVTLPPDALLIETVTAYNELIDRAEDPTDRDELVSLLPWLEARVRKRLKSARAQPGTGKRSA